MSPEPADQGAKRPRRPRRQDNGESKLRFGTLGFFCSLVVIVLLVALVQVIAASRPQVSGKQVTYSRFVNLAESGRIRTATILNADAYLVGEFTRANRTVGRYNTPYLKVGTSDQVNLLDVMLENNIDVKIDQQFGKSLVLPAILVIPTLIIIVLFFYFFMSWRRGTGVFGVRSGARKMEGKEVTESFADVAGQREAVEELRELVSFMSDTERFSDVGARTPKGVLLFGPPGCGKTLLARAFAGECGASFYSITGSDFVELYVGVGASRVRDLFKEARANAPAIIFIDELDAVGRTRVSDSAQLGGGEQEQALNQILAEMDGFSPSEGIMLLGATNRPDVLDQALLRPGRFDRSIGLERPGEEDRAEILELHARSRKVDPEVDMGEIAKSAYGMTGADLANVINEAALLAGREQKGAITQGELETAVKRVIEAPERQRRLSMRSRSVGKRATGIDEKITFADIAGADEAIEELAEVRDFLLEPERFASVGAEIPRGILLFGPPGCGKSLLARAVAGEAKGAFFQVSAAEFVEKFAGVGAGRVRDLFAEAKSVAPAIIFIDEIDAIGASRGGGGPDGSTDSARRDFDQTLNQILTELDGFDRHTGVIVIAATNRPDMLDPGLLRPGRFDRHIGIAPPDREARLKILSLHSEKRKLEPGVKLEAIAEDAHGMTGADLANVINQAALFAARARRGALSQADLEEALKRLIEAPERQRRLSARQRSVGKRATGMDGRVTFEDVAGVDDAIEELADVKDFLAEPERFAEIGAIAPRGILLTGPPGCGKTMLAKAVAGEANAAFLSASGSEFVEVWVGQGAARVRDLFAEAKAMAPAILFIDEIDSLGAKRGGMLGGGGGGREYAQTINQLLTELDGFEPRSGVILMGATNRPDILDPALLRPGRFDRQVEIRLPDRTGRRDILAVHAKGKSLAGDVDLDGLASVTQGFSGAELANVVNEAALLAGRKRLSEVPRTVMDEALDRVMMGVASRRHLPSEEERRSTAYHEAGHALVGLALPGITVPHRVSIVPRGGALGFVLSADEHERGTHSRTRLMNQLAMGLAGRAAEKLVFDEVNSGAWVDLQHVNGMARMMVCKYGMGESIGGVIFEGERWGEEDLSNFSEEEKRLIFTEVKGLVDDAEDRARQVMVDARAALDRIATELLERETLTADELREIAGFGDAEPDPNGSVPAPAARSA
ncbi:MAG: ATP-dependent metallopeptidase FtsH/Yme1/Tma family protein [Thermoleophilaceae bacterium]